MLTHRQLLTFTITPKEHLRLFRWLHQHFFGLWEETEHQRKTHGVFIRQEQRQVTLCCLIFLKIGHDLFLSFFLFSCLHDRTFHPVTKRTCEGNLMCSSVKCRSFFFKLLLSTLLHCLFFPFSPHTLALVNNWPEIFQRNFRFFLSSCLMLIIYLVLLNAVQVFFFKGNLMSMITPFLGIFPHLRILGCCPKTLLFTKIKSNMSFGPSPCNPAVVSVSKRQKSRANNPLHCPDFVLAFGSLMWGRGLKPDGDEESTDLMIAV